MSDHINVLLLEGDLSQSYMILIINTLEELMLTTNWNVFSSVKMFTWGYMIIKMLFYTRLNFQQWIKYHFVGCFLAVIDRSMILEWLTAMSLSKLPLFESSGLIGVNKNAQTVVTIISNSKIILSIQFIST